MPVLKLDSWYDLVATTVEQVKNFTQAVNYVQVVNDGAEDVIIALSTDDQDIDTTTSGKTIVLKNSDSFSRAISVKSVKYKTVSGTSKIRIYGDYRTTGDDIVTGEGLHHTVPINLSLSGINIAVDTLEELGQAANDSLDAIEANTDPASGPLKQTAVSVGTTAVALPTSVLANRRALSVQNHSGISLFLGDSAVTATDGYPLVSGSSMDLDVSTTPVVYGIIPAGAIGNNDVRVLELS